MATCIDNIFTNFDFIQAWGTLDWNFSDHLAVAIRRKRMSITPNKVAFVGRSYTNYVKEYLQSELIQHDWQTFFNSSDPS